MAHAGEQAAGEVSGEKSAFDDFVEKLEPVAKANEWAHVPGDLAMSDLYVDKMLEDWKTTAEKGVNSAKQAQSDLEKSLQDAFDKDVGSVAHDYDNGLASMEDVESAFANYDQAAKTASAATSDAVDSAQTGLNVAKAAGAASKVLGGLAIAGDAFTIVKPEDSGVMGTVDRVAAGANAAGTATALIAANASADWIPGVGEAVAAGTGLYLAGDFLYHNVKPIHDAADAVGHGVATAAKAVGSGISSAAHFVANLF